MRQFLITISLLLLVAGCSHKSAYEEMKNYRLTFLMSGTFQLEEGEYEDYLEDGRNGYHARLDREHCVKTAYKGETYYAAISVLNGGGTGFFYGVMVFKNGETVQSLELGDRIRVKSLTAADGKIQAEYFTHQGDEKLNDPPTLLVTDELSLADACADGTEYKRLYLKNPEEFHIMGQPLHLPDNSYSPEPELPPGDSKKYGAIGFSSMQDEAIEAFIPALQKALKTDDVEAILGMVDFPLRLIPPLAAAYTINDPEDFKRWYSRIFHPEYKENLLKLRENEFVCEYWGSHIDAGGIWLRPGSGRRVAIKAISY